MGEACQGGARVDEGVRVVVGVDHPVVAIRCALGEPHQESGCRVEVGGRAGRGGCEMVVAMVDGSVAEVVVKLK